jgi:hypothetical protein
LKIDKWEVGLFNKFDELATGLVVKYIKLPISRLILGGDEEPWGVINCLMMPPRKTDQHVDTKI